ncbi:MAG TPA: dockerin type I domain-containing protein [Phycisphaerales bacterium]|nr:dockerin type I domain-containing protein [Phycisphaerales bacterium]
MHTRIFPLFMCAAALASSSAARAETQPVRLWNQVWNAPSNHHDEPSDVLTLPDHSILVSGSAYNPVDAGTYPVLLHYSESGQLLWAHVESQYASFKHLLLSSTGDVLLIATTTIKNVWQVVVRRLNPEDGSTVWEAIHPASYQSNPFSPVIREDPATQSVLVATTLNTDFLMLRLDFKTGQLLDEHSYDGPQQGNDIATAIAPLDDGGFVIGGPVGGLAHGYRTIAANADGSIRWFDQENGQIGNVFTREWLGIDAQGNILAAGGPETSCGLFSFRAWKISHTGERLWTVETPTAGCTSGQPYAFALGSDGSIVLAGQSHNPFLVEVMHVDPDGANWVRKWPTTGNTAGWATTMDSAGNVIVAGINANDQVVLVGWTPTGDTLFTHADPALGVTVGAMSMHADGDGRYAVTTYAGEDISTSVFRRNITPGDVNGDGSVNINDLTSIILQWGQCSSSDCGADLTGDGQVNIDDLTAVILNWE